MGVGVVVAVVVKVSLEVVAMAEALVVLDDVGVRGGDGAGVLQVVVLRHVLAGQAHHGVTDVVLVNVLDDHGAVSEVGGLGHPGHVGADEVRPRGEGAGLLTRQLLSNMIADDHLLQLGVLRVARSGRVVQAVLIPHQLPSRGVLAGRLSVPFDWEALVEPAPSHAVQQKHNRRGNDKHDEDDDDHNDGGFQARVSHDGHDAAVVQLPVWQAGVSAAAGVAAAHCSTACGHPTRGGDVVAL